MVCFYADLTENTPLHISSSMDRSMFSSRGGSFVLPHCFSKLQYRRPVSVRFIPFSRRFTLIPVLIWIKLDQHSGRLLRIFFARDFFAFLSFLLFNLFHRRRKVLNIGGGGGGGEGGGQGLVYWGGPWGGQIPSRHMTSYWRRCDVTTSHRRYFDVMCPLLGFESISAK